MDLLLDYQNERADALGSDLLRSAQILAEELRASAGALDCDGTFPTVEIRRLAACGLLHAPFPAAMGGCGLGLGRGADALHDVLVAIGSGSLVLGRLYEGHVNAVVLVRRYGTEQNLRLLLREADAGRPTGVWMAGAPLHLSDAQGARRLRGHKSLASGCGYVRRPLVAADDDAGQSIMLLPDVDTQERADSSAWTAHGMRATATGTVNFSGIAISPDEVVGCPGDYLRSPFFRGGAWRVIAVQLGGLAAILAEYRAQLSQSPHRDHPLQLARYGEAAIAYETARLWVRHAAKTAESEFDDADAVDAYVDLARNAFETAALEVMARAQKAIGLKAFLRPNPLERMIRDLSTYMRQPALDASLISAARFHLNGAAIDHAGR